MLKTCSQIYGFSLHSYPSDFGRASFRHHEAYIRLCIGRDVVRLLEHPAFSVPLMIENLSWWAMDLCYTAFEPTDIFPELAKQVCLDNLLTAYRR